MKNQNGNSSFIFCLFLSLLFLSGLLLLKTKIINLKRLNKKLEFSLCVKRNNGKIKELTSKIRMTNTLLKTLTIGEYTSVFIPPFLGITLKYGLKKAIKALKLAQVSFYLSFMKHLNDLRRKGCMPSVNLVKTPYKIKLNGYERDIFNQAILRGKKWKFYIVKGKYYSTTVYSNLTKRTQTKIKRVSLF